jgi:hypothetical protein
MIMKPMSAFIVMTGCVAILEARAVDLPAAAPPAAESGLLSQAQSGSGSGLLAPQANAANADRVGEVAVLFPDGYRVEAASARRSGIDLAVSADPVQNSRVSLDPVVPHIGLRASYDWPKWPGGTVSGFVGAGADPAFGPPASTMRKLAGTDNANLYRTPGSVQAADAASIFTIGYAWRSFLLEGSTFASQEHEERRIIDKQPFKLDSSSTRLSYNPSPEWTFQFSRGNLGGLDPIDPYLGVRRTTLSATYEKDFQNVRWQTTFAWGRTMRRNADATMGYLAESTLRFSGSNAFFGRVEQARSDEIIRQNDAMQRELFMARKITVGYFRELAPQGSTRVDVGAFVSRYMVPSYAVASYGSSPTSLMVFMRARFQ